MLLGDTPVTSGPLQTNIVRHKISNFILWVTKMPLKTQDSVKINKEIIKTI